MTERESLPAILVDEIGLCHVRRGAILARTAFEPVFTFDDGQMVQAALKAETECYIAGQLVRGCRSESGLVSGDPAFDLACSLAHILNFAQVEESGSRLYVDLVDAPVALFNAFLGWLDEEFEFGWTDPGQIILGLSARGDASRSARVAASLRERGIGICLTEFGAAGAASALVESLRPECVQFEAGWVRRAARLDPARRLLGSLVGLLGDKGISAMLEGVANEAELDIARQAGIDLIRGPYLAPSYAAGVAQSHRRPAGPDRERESDPAANVVRLTGRPAIQQRG